MNKDLDLKTLFDDLEQNTQKIEMTREKETYDKLMEERDKIKKSISECGGYVIDDLPATLTPIMKADF